MENLRQWDYHLVSQRYIFLVVKKNIFNEIKHCYPNYVVPKHGLLKRWTKKEKNVMLNSALTVIAEHSNSHMKLTVAKFY